MERKLKFVKEEDNRWFVVLNDWQYDRDALEMVAGADSMLDIISGFSNSVTLKLSTEEFDSKYKIVKIHDNLLDDMLNGANYRFYTDDSFTMDIWLCAVTIFVFSEYPETVWINRI